MTHDLLIDLLRQLQGRIRDAVIDACEKQAVDHLAAVAHDDEGDTIYAIDKVSEALLVESMTQWTRQVGPIVLIAEGIEGGKRVLPAGEKERNAVWRIIVDPIDGTRGIMFQKRSAWVLAGAAPNRGEATNLRDIELAVMTEIPLVKQHLSDQLWAVRGKGVIAARHNRLTGESRPIALHPSRASGIDHGCASLARFFPGARDVLAGIDDEIARELLGAAPGKAMCFEDQYASTGGQLYELIAGHDRFVADVRPLMRRILAERGLPMPLCCHPYDLSTVLIAEEMGVLVTDERGGPLNAPLNVEADVCWAGYANATIRGKVEPALRRALETRGLLEGMDA